jgi:hypothetical protein
MRPAHNASSSANAAFAARAQQQHVVIRLDERCATARAFSSDPIRHALPAARSTATVPFVVVMMSVLPATLSAVNSRGELPSVEPADRLRIALAAQQHAVAAQLLRLAHRLVDTPTGTMLRAPFTSAAPCARRTQHIDHNDNTPADGALHLGRRECDVDSHAALASARSAIFRSTSFVSSRPAITSSSLQQLEQERDRRVDALDDERLQRDARPHQRLLARVAVHDQLADQRVVVRRHHVAGVRMRVHAHARPARRMEDRDLAGTRREVALRVLGVDAALDAVAAQFRRLRDRQRLARRHADLLLHQVHARHQLRHRMLDLDARVHLHEVEAAVLVEQELDRARREVADRLRTARGRLAHALAQLRRQRRPTAPPRSASGAAAAASIRARRGAPRCRGGRP